MIKLYDAKEFGVSLRFNSEILGVGADLLQAASCGTPSATMEYANCVASALGISLDEAIAKVEEYMGTAIARATGLAPEQITAIAACGTPSMDVAYVSCVASTLGIDVAEAQGMLATYLGVTEIQPRGGRCYPVDSNGRLLMKADANGNLISPPVTSYTSAGTCPPNSSETPLPFIPTPRPYLKMVKPTFTQRSTLWTANLDPAVVERLRAKTAGGGGATGDGMSTGMKVALGIGAVVVVGALVYFGSR